jgi:hypothetical protein
MQKSRKMIFCSPTGLRILCRALFRHCDGTFHCAAKYFTQLCIMQGLAGASNDSCCFHFDEVLLKEGIKLYLVLNPTVSKTYRVQILICKIFQLIKLRKS